MCRGLKLAWLVAAVAMTVVPSGFAANTQARLALTADSARPGDTLLAGVHFHMAKGWHIYWRNSGQSGLPPTIEWDLPKGVTVGDIQWPVPKKLPEPEQTTYIYENDVVLLVPLSIAKEAAPGSVNLQAKLSWLECNTKCINENANVSAKLVVGSEAKPSKDAQLLEEWKSRLPKPGDSVAPHGWWEGKAVGDSRPVVLEWMAVGKVTEADFFPDSSEKFEVQPMTEKLLSTGDGVRLRAQVKKLSGEWPSKVSGLLIQRAGGQETAYEAKISIAETAPDASAAASAPSGAARQPIWLIFVYAFLGGMLLNIMPCVLPVIALKILGFVSEARNETRHVRKLGLVYTVGVLSSFLVLALIVLGLQAAGKAAGWGFQFSNPYFLVVMTTLVTLIALNLFGVYEITLSSGALTAASTLASKQGSAGAFFNGLLTTLLATSCTAPFLAPAVGFAAVLSNPIFTILIMLTVGAGLAAPYLVLTWQPKWLKFLPKPGAWMQKFKVGMGFPMIAAAAWLCSILAVHYGDRAWWLVMFLVFVAVAAWVYGEFVQRGRSHRGLAVIACAILLVIGYLYTLENKLEWRSPLTASSNVAGNSKVAPKGLPWQPWSAEAVAAARAAGRPVVVDFTAKWCPTCNTIVKPSFEKQSVQEKLKQSNAVTLIADYTLRPDDITAELKRFQRAGVPMVLVYPARPEEEPKAFDLVWPGTIVEALEWATPQKLPQSAAK
jgi:thiol:disulfide interchange protein DsbD